MSDATLIEVAPSQFRAHPFGNYYVGDVYENVTPSEQSEFKEIPPAILRLPKRLALAGFLALSLLLIGFIAFICSALLRSEIGVAIGSLSLIAGTVLYLIGVRKARLILNGHYGTTGTHR